MLARVMDKLNELFPITRDSVLANDIIAVTHMAKCDAEKDKKMSESWNKIRMESTIKEWPEEWQLAYKSSYELVNPSS